MRGFGAWFRSRPAIGGLLVALSGVELFFSGQLDIGTIHVQLGIEGLQATIVPIALVALGVLVVLMPVHRIFYGVIALALAVYSLIGVNLGGFIIGMLLGAVGGVLVVAWMPKTAAADSGERAAVEEAAVEEAVGVEQTSVAQVAVAQVAVAEPAVAASAVAEANRPLARGRR